MTAPIGAQTRLAGVIGDPIEHSLSPVLHNAAYQLLGLDMVYLAFRIPAGGVADALLAARSLGLVGLSVTMPHKQEVASRCDRLGPQAEVLESANTVTFEADATVGESTDGEGFLRSLVEADVEVSGRSVLVLGAGGAARAVAVAMERAGATVAVSARRPGPAQSLADLLESGRSVPWEDRDQSVRESQLVVNATPAGMYGTSDNAEHASGADLVVSPKALSRSTVLAELVYHPRETALMRAAVERGARTVDGLGMLVHQAGLQVERWTGRRAPIAPMRAAVEAELSQS